MAARALGTFRSFATSRPEFIRPSACEICELWPVSAPCRLVGRPEIFPLKISKRAKQLAIPDLVPTGEQGLQCHHERNPLLGLQRAGGVDDGERLRFGDIHGRHFSRKGARLSFARFARTSPAAGQALSTASDPPRCDARHRINVSGSPLRRHGWRRRIAGRAVAFMMVPSGAESSAVSARGGS